LRCVVERAAQHLTRFREAAALEHQERKMMERLLVGRIDFPHAAKAALSFLRFASFAEREAEVVQRRHVIRRGFERPAVAFDGPAEVARRLTGVALLLEPVGDVRDQGV
jgi:hypothetical protein